MRTDRLQAKLSRFDRRLKLRKVPGESTKYDIIYKDAGGIEAVAVHSADISMGDLELFQAMMISSPWKQNAAYGEWMRQFDERNDGIEDTSNLSRSAAEEAWERLKFYKNNDERIARWRDQKMREAAC